MRGLRSPVLITALAVILMLWGGLFAFFGLGVLPVDRAVLQQWETALYGAIMIGWGATLLLVGRIAWTRRDPSLARALRIGLGVWLAIEAAFSARLGVWFNAESTSRCLHSLVWRSPGLPKATTRDERMKLGV
ncbi:MAG TPA: hypothetical protein VIC24_06435 [Gemmatimonadaceae bacterium]